MIVGNSKTYENYGVQVHPDLIKEKGPVGGIYTGLFYSKQQTNLIISCDIPNIKKDLIEFLIREYKGEDALICSFQGKYHPLFGLYKKSTFTVFKKHIDQNELKLMNVLLKINYNTLEVPSSMIEQLTNVNTKQDYKNFLKKKFK